MTGGPGCLMPATSSTGTGSQTASLTTGTISILRHRRSAMRPLPWPSARRNAMPNFGGFTETSNGQIGLVPLFTQFDNLVMREHVQGYIYYPDAVPALAKLSLG